MGILVTNVLHQLPQCSEWLRKMRSTAESKKVVFDAQLRVAGIKRIMEPGRSSVDVQTTGPKVEDDMLVEPFNYPIAGSISAVPTLVKSTDGSYKFRVVNMSTSDLWLKPHSEICKVSEVDSVDKDGPVDFRQLSKDDVVVDLRPYHSHGSQLENNSIIGESEEKLADSEKRLAEFTIHLKDEEPVNQPYRRIHP